MVEVNDMSMVQSSMQLDFSVNLKRKKTYKQNAFVDISMLRLKVRANKHNATKINRYMQKQKHISAHTFSLWWGLATRVWGIIFAAYSLLVVKSVNS